MAKTKDIVRNRIQCLHCGDILESCFRHNWVTCMCGATYADGGSTYARRGFTPYESEELGNGYDELTEWSDE